MIKFPDDTIASRTDRLLTYFQSGAVVCPYARRARYEFFSDDAIEAQCDRFVIAVTERAVAVVVASGLRNGRAWTTSVHERLCHALGVFPVVLRGKLRPNIDAGTFSAYAIGMGPSYIKQHSRYAPELCLVVVSGEAIREVSLLDRGPIRQAVIARMGATYDADQVWLP